MRAPANLRGIFASALAALIVGVGILTVVAGYSATPAVKAVQFLMVIGLGAILIGGVIVLVLVRLAGWRAPEEEFEMIVRRAERLAEQDPWTYDEYEDDGPDLSDWADEEERFDFSDEEDFRALVRSAVDELPLEFHRALEHVAIVVADRNSAGVGRGRRRVYGQYQGDADTQDYFHDRILLFREPLLRDFGHDPDLLREQVLRTVRNELSHHLGSNGNGVRGL